MDFLQKIGGRKFLMALIGVGVATFIELKTERGLSTVMASFLASIVAAFSVANYATTSKHMETKNGSGRDNSTDQKLDQLLEITSAANSPETINNLTQLLGNISSGVAQVGSGMVSLGQEVKGLKNRRD